MPARCPSERQTQVSGRSLGRGAGGHAGRACRCSSSRAPSPPGGGSPARRACLQRPAAHLAAPGSSCTEVLCWARGSARLWRLSATGDADTARLRCLEQHLQEHTPPAVRGEGICPPTLRRNVQLEPEDGTGMETQQGSLSPSRPAWLAAAPHSRAPHPRGNGPPDPTAQPAALRADGAPLWSCRFCFSSPARNGLFRVSDLTSMVRPLGRAQCPPLASQTHTHTHTHIHTSQALVTGSKGTTCTEAGGESTQQWKDGHKSLRINVSLEAEILPPSKSARF